MYRSKSLQKLSQRSNQTTFKDVFFLCVIFRISKTSLVLFHSLFPWIFCSADNTVFCVDPKIIKFDSLQLQSFVCELGWGKLKEFWIGNVFGANVTRTFCSLQRKTKTFYNESSVVRTRKSSNLLQLIALIRRISCNGFELNIFLILDER